MPKSFSSVSPLDDTQWVILIIDDTFDNRMIAQMVLQNAGVHVYTAATATEALAVLESVIPTAILLDIRIPQMNGIELLRVLRAYPETAHIPVIAFTALAMEGDRERFLAEGFDGYISKPFDVLTLFAQVREVVNRHPTSR